MGKLIPYGIANFKKIRTKGYYYVDKTGYIKNLEMNETTLFLRPRRFGKSLFSEMLRCYYDFKLSNNFNTLFEGLNIAKNPTENQGKYFVLNFDFSGINIKANENICDLEVEFNKNIRVNIANFIDYYKAESRTSSKAGGLKRREPLKAV